MATSNDVFLNICDSVDQPTVLLNRALSVLHANQAFCEVIGLSREELRDQSAQRLPNGRWNAVLQELLADGDLPVGSSVSSAEFDWKQGAIGSHSHRVTVCRVTEGTDEDCAVFLVSLREVTESRLSLSRHATMAKLLYRVTSLAAASHSLNETLEFCLSAICDLTGWPFGYVFIAPEDDSEALISTDIESFPDGCDHAALRRAIADQTFRIGEDLPGEVWKSRRICWKEDIRGSVTLPHVPKAFGILAAIGVPVHVGERVRAVLLFLNTSVTPQSADVLMFCHLMSEPLGRVIEREETAQRLRRAKESSERANAVKSQFLANISHELRTPMSGVLGMLQLALQENLSDEVRAQLFSAQRSATKLMSLLNDILDFAGLESGTLSIVPESFCLRDFLTEAIEPHVALIRKRGLRWVFDVHRDVPDELVGDSVRLRQIVDHLLENAARFTEQGSIELHVTCGVAGSDGLQSLCFSITDTGPGLSPEDQRIVLEGFTQKDSSFTRRHGGAGLGLAICRTLATQLGGQLECESELGAGCVIRVSVPFRLGQPAPKKTEETANRSTPHECLRSVTSQPLAILLTEDTPANQRAIQSILKRRGHHVTIAVNGRDAVEKVARQRFDVVLMDLQMPVMDGYQATEAIREMERHSGFDTRIIALTAHSTQQDRDTCQRAGMNGYLTKPIDTVTMITTVESDSEKRRVAKPVPTVETPQKDESKGRVIDLEATMKRLGGDEGLLQEFIEVFDEDAPSLLESLQRGVFENDFVMVSRAAHSLRGLAANFSATEVVSLASKLEAAGKNRDISGAEILCARLSVAMTQLNLALAALRTT